MRSKQGICERDFTPSVSCTPKFAQISETLLVHMTNEAQACALLTLGAHAQEVTVVVRVCLSVKSHLTSGASVPPENTVMYSGGNGRRKICGFFSETAPLRISSTPSVESYTFGRPFPAESAHAHYSIKGHEYPEMWWC